MNQCARISDRFYISNKSIYIKCICGGFHLLKSNYYMSDYHSDILTAYDILPDIETIILNDLLTYFAVSNRSYIVYAKYDGHGMMIIYRKSEFEIKVTVDNRILCVNNMYSLKGEFQSINIVDYTFGVLRGMLMSYACFSE